MKLYHASIKNVFLNHDSLVVLDNDGIRFNRFPQCTQFDSSILFKRFYSYCTYNGKKVVGSQDSLYYIDKKFIPYPLNIHFNYRAVDLTTKDSLLIATTAEKGVFFIKDSTVVKNMNSTNGFSTNTCYKSVIYKDELFTATNKGINIYNFKTDSIFQLFESDGLPSNTVFDLQVCNDTIYAATEAGLSIIPTSAIPHSRSFPLFANPVITNGDTLWSLPKSVSVYSNQPITFVLNALSFGPKTPLQYHYRIKGIDSTFKITTDQNLNVSKLDYGNYQLESYAVNGDGLRSNTLLISIIIKPYFYQTKLCKGIVLLLFGLTLFLIISYMIRRSKKIEFRKNEEKNKMIFLELNAWRSAINPHFLFNSLNAIQGFFNQQDSNNTNKFIAQFSSILRKTIDQSGKILNKIEDEIIYLTHYLELETIKRKNAFEFHIHCDDEALKMLYIPTLVIQNIVENSIKHGVKENTKGTINITFSSADDYVLCTITDNGNGFKLGEINKETSKGFQLLKRKLKIVEKLIGRNIQFSFSNRYDKNQSVIGTEAIFTFPKLTFDYDFYRSNHRR
ncbi:MAG: histidine kinase [Bacteroidetes bacterium]|nr:histidine kinase [Bacteroidota bacterium]